MSETKPNLPTVNQVAYNPVKNEIVDEFNTLTKRGLWSRLSLEDLSQREGAELVVMDGDKAHGLVKQQHITPVKEITEERYNWLLNCLPPSGYKQYGGMTSFWMCERIYADVAQYCVAIHGK